ncbi:MAG: septum formation initiator family protein [Clostridia bacterium]|nr:septum formation initiator family protein [Clostridia bacterium]
MTRVKEKKHNKSFLLRTAALLFIIYIVYALITQQTTLREKREELQQIYTQIADQQARNNELAYEMDSEKNGFDNYVENYARTELDFAKQGERVFVDIG